MQVAHGKLCLLDDAYCWVDAVRFFISMLLFLLYLTVQVSGAGI